MCRSIRKLFAGRIRDRRDLRGIARETRNAEKDDRKTYGNRKTWWRIQTTAAAPFDLFMNMQLWENWNSCSDEKPEQQQQQLGGISRSVNFWLNCSTRTCIHKSGNVSNAKHWNAQLVVPYTSSVCSKKEKKSSWWCLLNFFQNLFSAFLFLCRPTNWNRISISENSPK